MSVCVIRVCAHVSLVRYVHMIHSVKEGLCMLYLGPCRSATVYNVVSPLALPA